MRQDQQFTEILKYLRNQEGWSQSYLAAKLDISAGTYSSYERGLSEPTLSILIKLTRLFNVSIDYMALGKEFIMPLTVEESNLEQLDLVALRLENRIDRQTRLLSYISGKLENDLSSLVKQYSEEYIELFSRTSGTMVLEEELWKIERCSRKTLVAYPNCEEFLHYDEKSNKYTENNNFSNLVSSLRMYPENCFVDIYANNVDIKGIEKYKELIVKRCGKAALKRVEVWQCNQPIITQYVIYDLLLTKLKEKHPSLFDLVIDYVIDDRYMALLISPQIKFHGVNFLTDKDHCNYVINHFNHLLKHAVRI